MDGQTTPETKKVTSEREKIFTDNSDGKARTDEQCYAIANFN